MNYLIYGRAAPRIAGQDTPELDEAHWSYMDAFADRMIARGPTLSTDRTAWTGSLHVVDLDNRAAADAFALNDPYHRAGMFQDHLIRRFDNLLGRTMWDTTPHAGDVPFLILAHLDDALPAAATRHEFASPTVAERLVLWGALHRADGPRDPSRPPGGLALALLAPHATAARTLVAAEPALVGESTNWELHAWEFGGRR